MKFIKNHGGRENYYPTKLKKDMAGDCVVRAISIGTKQDYLLEGDFTSTLNDFTSLDGTVTGTLAQVLVEDIINLGTVDSINFGSGTVACTIKTTFKYA